MEKTETRNKRPKLWTIGWLATFGAIPLGSSLLGFPFLLVSRLISLFKKKNPADSLLPVSKLSSFTIKTFYVFLLAMTLSSALSAYPWLGPTPQQLGALPQTAGFALMIYVFMFGGRLLGRNDQKFLVETCLPVLAVSSVAASLISMIRFFYFPNTEHRAVDIITGWNGFGTVLIIIGGLTLGYLNMRGGKWRFWIIPYLGVIIPTLIITKSRGGWFGFLAMLTSLALFKRKLLVILVIVVLLAGCIFVSYPPLKDRFFSSFSTAENISRIFIWRSTINMIKDYPFLGVGTGVFPFIYHKYVLPNAPEKEVSFAHNIFLQVLAEFGLIGFILFFSVIFSVLYMGFRLALGGNPVYQGIFAVLIGVLVHQQVDLPIWGFDIGGMFWMLIGVVVGLYESNKQLA